MANATKLNNVEIHSDKLYNVNLSNNKYLRKLDLSGCSTLGTVTATGSVLDVSQCKYLSYLNIYDTALTGVLLNTSGGSLKEIYYPKTIQEVQLIKQTLLETIGLPYGKNGSEIPTSLYTVNIQECPSVKKLNTSSNPEISKTWISMKYCQNLTIRNALDFETITLDGFQRLKVLRLENMFKLKSLGFDDMLPVGEASTLQYMGISYCPELIDITMNCTSNDYEITFAKGALLNLSGATKLNSISSNCVIHGLETIVLPLSIKHLYFTNEYGTGYSSIKNIWSSRCCEINEEGVLPVAIRYEDQDYIGMDLQGMKLNDIDLGALVNIPRAINFDLSPTTVNPNFNINRDGVEYPYLQPEGVLNLSNYTESLARFFNGVDLDKLEVVVENPLPQTDLSYCFYNSSFSNENLLSPILSNVSNVNNLDYCFYKTTIKSPNIVNNISFENGTMNYTFGECKNITALNGFTVSSGVTSSIGLFSGCPITTITNTKINTNGSCSAIFKGCTSLTNASGLVMPNTSDISSAFEECTKLTGMPFIEITDKITDISKLYYGCINIDNIDGMVFGSSISNSEDWINKEQIVSANNVTIKNNAMSFEGYINLITCNNLLITSNVKTLANYYKNCAKLNSITFNPESVFSNIKSMAYMLSGCSSLINNPILEIPDSAINIDYLYTGTNITDISGLVIGSGVTSAVSWYPPNLTTANNVIIKNNIINFTNNKTLQYAKNLSRPNSNNWDNFFKGCTALKEDIIFPSNTVSVVNCFNGCTKMTHIHSNWENEYENEIVATDCYAGCTGITHIDNENIIAYEGDLGLDYIPEPWGGNGFDTLHTSLIEIVVPEGGGNFQPFFYYYNATKTTGIRNVDTRFRLSWGDGTVSSVDSITPGNTRLPAHTYTKGGTYYVKGHFYYGTYGNASCAGANYVKKILRLARFKDDLVNGDNEISDFSNAFYYLTEVTYIDVSNLITSTHISVKDMFRACKKLTTIVGLDTWDTSNVTDFTGLFNECNALTSLDLTGLNWNSATKIPSMFASCRSLETIRGIDTLVNERITALDNTFTDCYKLRFNFINGKPSWTFSTSTATNYGSFMNKCGRDLVIDASEDYILDLSDCGTIVSSNFNWAFAYSGFTKITLRVDVSTAVGGSTFFGYCPRLKELNISGKWGNSMDTFLNNCQGITSLDLSKLDLSKVKNTIKAFNDCTSLERFTVGSQSLSSLRSLSWTFSNCSKLTSIDISKWDFSKVAVFDYMFHNCKSLSSIIGVESINISSATNIACMFDTCSLPIIDTRNWTIPSTAINMDNFVNAQNNCREVHMTLSGVYEYAFHVFKASSAGCKFYFHNCTIQIGKYVFPTHGGTTDYQIEFDNCVITAMNEKNGGGLTLNTGLTVESILSLFNALEDKSGSASAVCKIGSANLAKLSPAQIAIATNKNWTVS